MFETGEYSISEFAEVFSVSRPTTYRTLNRQLRAKWRSKKAAICSISDQVHRSEQASSCKLSIISSHENVTDYKAATLPYVARCSNDRFDDWRQTD